MFIAYKNETKNYVFNDIFFGGVHRSIRANNATRRAVGHALYIILYYI